MVSRVLREVRVKEEIKASPEKMENA